LASRSTPVGAAQTFAEFSASSFRKNRLNSLNFQLKRPVLNSSVSPKKVGWRCFQRPVHACKAKGGMLLKKLCLEEMRLVLFFNARPVLGARSSLRRAVAPLAVGSTGQVERRASEQENLRARAQENLRATPPREGGGGEPPPPNSNRGHRNRLRDRGPPCVRAWGQSGSWHRKRSAGGLLHKLALICYF
jgi:hypothetical protein